jgi:hypothetical protein
LENISFGFSGQSQRKRRSTKPKEGEEPPPRNLYLLLLDRARKARTGPGRPNVHVVGDPGFANPRGASALAETLYGAALLLQLGQEWDRFVPLDAADYRLVILLFSAANWIPLFT